MSDIRCAVCGEPWDQWGANHGDMKWWEYDLFKAGAGCSACEGDTGQHQNVEVEDGDALVEHVRSIVMNAEDPDDWAQLHADEDAGSRKWEEPEPKKLWECAGCKVQVVISNDAPYDGNEIQEEDDWLEWCGGEKVHYGMLYTCSYGDLYQADEPTREPELFLDEKPHCAGCAGHCRECSKVILTREQPDDPNDPGASFPHPHSPFYGTVCITCLYELETVDDEDEDENEQA